MLTINSLIYYFLFNCISTKLKVGTCSFAGRNFSGKICVFHKGGANKKKNLLIDFKRRINQHGIIYNVVHDSKRSSFIGLIFYDNGYFSHIVLSSSVSIGDRIFSGVENLENFNTGDSTLLSFFDIFSIVNNIELKPFFGSSLARAAGVGATIISRNNYKVCLKLNSG